MNGENGINRDMISYYKDRAQEYDRKAYDPHEQPERQADIKEASRILQDVFTGKSVLEIAAGPGFWTTIIAQAAKSITATDVNEAVIDLARKKQYPEGKVTFRVADMYALGDMPLHDALFGGFIFSHILKQDYDKFLDAINGYVRPGGSVVLMDNNRTLTPRPADRTDEQGNNYRLRTLEDGSKHEIVKNYPTQEELRSVLRNRSTGMDFKNMEHYWILTYRTST
ncbi:methyltransferase domain-containing protein [Candidatus Kaiserbacteria bacterium]|nr:methyltransferase domain-containing protein [Candidatus Kaiserbacteria bacterium]